MINEYLTKVLCYIKLQFNAINCHGRSCCGWGLGPQFWDEIVWWHQVGRGLSLLINGEIKGKVSKKKKSIGNYQTLLTDRTAVVEVKNTKGI